MLYLSKGFGSYQSSHGHASNILNESAKVILQLTKGSNNNLGMLGMYKPKITPCVIVETYFGKTYG